MAKAVKKKEVEPPDGKWLAALQQLKYLHSDMEKFVEGPGSVADRQLLVDRLKAIIEQL